MSYGYETLKPDLFKEENQQLFIKIRDQVNEMMEHSGAVQMGHAMRLPSGIGASDSWLLMACVDRLIELGEIVEIPRPQAAGQHRVFVKKGR